MEIIDRVKDIAGSYLADHGIELVDILYRREQQGMVLRLLVDTRQGISLKECEELNNYLSDILDAEDVMQEHYIIEVSSPGLDRPILTDSDFKRSIGKELDITTYALIDGRRTHVGTLAGINNDSIVIEANGVSTVIPRSGIAKAILYIEI